MELADTLTWEGFTKDTLYEALRDRIRGTTREETKKQVYRYEDTAQIKARETGYYEWGDFTL